MNNWRGSGGMYPLSSNLSAFALPFTAPRVFPYPNSMPNVDSAEGSGDVVPLNSERNGWDGPSITGLSANWYSSFNHEVDPAMPPFANYYPFSGAKTNGEMDGQLFSLDLPVGVTSTDHYVVSHLGSLGKDTVASPSHPSYSLLGGAGNDSLMTANQPGFGGSSASKPGIGKSDKSFSDHHARVFSSNADACDDRLDETAAQYPPKTARIDGSFRLEEGNLASRHTAGTCNRKDVWTNEWGGPATKYPHESVRIDGNIWLVEGQLPPQRLTGTSNGGVPWNDGWGGPAVEYPLKSAQVVGEELQHQASRPELASDIWKQQTLLTPLWEQSMWCNGSDPDYENLVMKSASVPATGSQPDASSISIRQVTQSNGNSEIGGNDEIFADLMPFHAMKSHPLLDAVTELQFDADYHRIQPDTKAFGNLYVSDDEGLPKDKFPSKNLFDHMRQSNSSCRFSSLYMDNSAGAASSQSHLAYDLATSNPWSFHHSDGGMGSRFLDKGPLAIKSLDQPGWDGFYAQDIPIQSGSWAPSQTNRTEYHNQEISVKDSGSFFKPPAIFYTSDGEQRFDGTVEAGSSWSKELQSPHGTGGDTATEPDVLQVSSHNVDLNSCFPLSQKLNEGERTPCKMHLPCGNTVTTSEMCVGNLADVVAEVSSSVLVKENSDFSVSVHASQNLIDKEKSESIPKVDLQAMVLTLHNLSELLYYYASTGKCEVREEDHHLLEKAIHNLAACSLKDVVLTANKEELLKSLEVNPQLHLGQLEHQFIGDNEPVKSMSDSEENNFGMLSSGVGPHVVKEHYSTQIFSNRKQQRTDEGKFSLETFSSGVNSHTAKDDNVIQAIKEILSQYCHDGHEPDPQVHFFRNLWLGAEAELCSQNCKARFNRLKSKLDASGIKDSSDTASAVERPTILATSVNFIAEDIFPGTRSLEQSNNIIGSTRSCDYAEVGGVSDVMARFNILKGRSCDPELRKDPTGEEQLPAGAPSPLIMTKDAEADILTEKAGISSRVSRGSVLIDTTCCGENIDDAVMTRFNILMQRDESLSFKPENSASMEAAMGRFEEKMCSTARDFPAHNKSEALTSSFFEHAESLPPCISESSVMSRWNILKQRAENAGSIENIVYREMVEVERRDEPIDGYGAREIGCLYPDIMHNYNTLSSSSWGEQGTDSVLDRLKILKQRDGNQSSTGNNFLLQESVDLGAAIRGDYLSAFGERSAEGSIAKAKYVLQKESSSLADDTATLDCGLGAGDNSAIGSHLEGKSSGGWFDVTSSDWEHVSKEEVIGRITKS